MSMLRLLSETSYPTFRLEWTVFFANHLPHGVVALDRLGADEKRINQFVEKTSKILIPETDPVTPGPIEDVRGMMKSFPQIYSHFKAKAVGKSIDELLKEELPSLIEGLGGSILHPLIHIGYGYNVGCMETIIDGLAYMFYSYLDLPSSIKWTADGRDDLQAVLKDLAEDEVLKLVKGDKLGDLMSFKKDRDINDERRRYYELHVFHGDRIMSYVKRLGVAPPKTRTAAVKAVFDASAHIYVRSEVPNDFFLLHGMTAAWSLKEIVHLLPSDEAAVEAAGDLMGCILAMYLGICSTARLTGTAAQGAATGDWAEIKKRAVSMDADPHIYKVVHVTDDMAREFPEDGALYQQAAEMVMDYKLSIEDRPNRY